jgi:peptidoglycan/xylan/chitin deacetylase (PgdA/CDA1 family)
MRFFYIPDSFTTIHRKFTFHFSSQEKKIYLTFDDGPNPEVTTWILDTLKHYNALATFFCVGNNVRNHPGIYKSICEAGHSVGNHTQNHRNSLKTGLKQYIDDVLECTAWVESRLFRPPYGKIRARVASALISKGYKIVLWSVLSYDFDKTLDHSVILQKSIRHTKPGSIIVFHDNIKTVENLKAVLPAYLDHFSSLGYTFVPIRI